MAYFPSLSVAQNVIVDDNNSSEANLAAAATFTGTATSTLGVVGIQVTIKTDQNCTIYVDQSPDGTNWDISDELSYWHSLGGNGWTVQAQNSYIRARVTNIGDSTTSYFRLQTVLCPIVEAVPRTLDKDGHFVVSVHHIKGYLGDDNDVEVSPNGNMRTVIPTKLVGGTFHGAVLDPSFWTTTGSTGSGGVTESGGVATISTGTTADSIARLNSVRFARFIPGATNYFRATCGMNASTGTNARRVGMYDSDNGFFFQHDGTNMSLVCRKATSDTNTVTSGSFNGVQGTTFTVEEDTSYKLEIYATNTSVYFLINDILIHTFSAAGVPLVSTLNLPIRAESINSGGNDADNTILISSAAILRLGPLETEGIYKNIPGAATNVLKYGPGKLHSVIINSAVAGTTTIYDNTAATGTLIATITVDSKAVAPTPIRYDAPFFTGLTIVTTGASHNITVVYE